MIYRSNLSAPDLTPQFKHLRSRLMGHSFGHDVLSDWADKSDDDPVYGIYKRCGLWTHDEAAILYNIAAAVKGSWIDIGAHTGWTTAHISAAARCWAYPIEPMHAVTEFLQRFCDNLGFPLNQYVGADCTSDSYFRQKKNAKQFIDGCVIDGDHEPGMPLADAINTYQHLNKNGVIMFHDFIGRPVRDAVLYLIEQGMRVRLYLTPHIVACCYRPPFEPPHHIPDPDLVMQNLPARWREYDWARCF